MARPKKEGMDYFPHDTDAVNDEKIEALTLLYGAKGYAFYFILLERIYRTANFELNVSDAETGEEIKQILSRKIAITVQEFDKILSTALKWGCFDREAYEKRGVLTSNGIKKRARVVLEKREKMRAKYQHDKRKVSDAETGEETGAETPQSKEKKSKVNNIYSAVVNYLNEKAGTKYKPTTKATQRLINARLNEGFTEADFKTVIDKKVAEWRGTDMAKYLRPETLFGTKFEAYLNQSVSGTKSTHPEGFEVIR